MIHGIKSSFSGQAFAHPNLLIVRRIVFCFVIAICLSIMRLLGSWKQSVWLSHCIFNEYVLFLLSVEALLDLSM